MALYGFEELKNYRDSMECSMEELAMVIPITVGQLDDAEIVSHAAKTIKKTMDLLILTGKYTSEELNIIFSN